MIAKKHRINREFIPYILRKGKSLKSKLFIIRYCQNKEEFSRFRTIVSTKIDKKAVERNKLRRQIYEAIRIISKEIQPNPPLDIVFIPKKSIKKAKYSKIEEDLKLIYGSI